MQRRKDAELIRFGKKLWAFRLVRFRQLVQDREHSAAAVSRLAFAPNFFARRELQDLLGSTAT